MRKSSGKLTLARETLRLLEGANLRRAAGGQIWTSVGPNCNTDTSCGYFICEPSNPIPCNTVPAE
jgi:hypothetical protein